MFTPSESPIQSLASWRALRFWFKRHFISTKWKSIIHIHLLLRHFSLDSSSCLSTLGKRTGLIYITDILVMVWRYHSVHCCYRRDEKKLEGLEEPADLLKIMNTKKSHLLLCFNSIIK
uniref:Uncharacterized protein n=1 Tax=Pongo abelii TaxID=9601 RepID=A0A8I5YM89_PONAB